MTWWPSPRSSPTGKQPGSSEVPTVEGIDPVCYFAGTASQSRTDEGGKALTVPLPRPGSCTSEIQAGAGGSPPTPLSRVFGGRLLAAASWGVFWGTHTPGASQALRTPDRQHELPHLILAHSAPAGLSPDTQSQALGLRAPTHNLWRDTAQPVTHSPRVLFPDTLETGGSTGRSPFLTASCPPPRRETQSQPVAVTQLWVHILCQL